MIEMWSIFDIMYLSQNRAEMVNKLVELIRFRNTSQRNELIKLIMYNNIPGRDYGKIVCQLVSNGDLAEVLKFIKENIYYKDQDYLLGSLLD